MLTCNFSSEFMWAAITDPNIMSVEAEDVNDSFHVWLNGGEL